MTGELSQSEMEAVETHLVGCAACAALVSQSGAVDALVRRAVEEQASYPMDLDRRIRKSVKPTAIFWRPSSIALATAACLLIVVTAFTWRSSTVDANYRLAAAEDFNREVILNRNRPWVTAPQAVQALSARVVPMNNVAATMAPAGFQLEKAKICSLSGTQFLHLIYSQGPEHISIHIGPKSDLWWVQRRSGKAVAHGINVSSVKASKYLIMVESTDLDPTDIAEKTAHSLL
jgi:anti-sigma factor RsiW